MTASTDALSAAEESLADIVRAFSEPFRTGDTSTYAAILADDRIDIPLAEGQEQGPAGMPDQIAGFRLVMPDYTVTHEDVIVSGDRVVVRNTVSGTHLGAFMGYEPTGRHLTMRRSRPPGTRQRHPTTTLRSSVPAASRAWTST